MALGNILSYLSLRQSNVVLGKSHPYSPANAPIPAFKANEGPFWVMTASFAAIVTAVLGASVLLAKRRNPRVKSLFALCWFTLSAFLHCVFEAYFIANHGRIAGMQGLFARLWKEYALSDSRYLTLDPFVLSIESLTVLIWGPLCIATVVSIVRDSPMRHPLQVIVCVGHLYGVALYFSSCFAEMYLRGVSHSRPEFLYFWVYFVGFNLPWAVIPSVLLVSSFKTLHKAMAVMMQVEAALGRKQHKAIQPPPVVIAEPKKKKEKSGQITPR
jgi:cholestenol delta-isomerase